MKKRTFEDWEIASQRIHYVSNDFLTITNLRTEFIYLGYLDVMLDEMCDESILGSAMLSLRPRVTMLSRLFMMHAYEVVRSLDEFDGVGHATSERKGRHINSGGSMANFETGRFKELKKELEQIRMPMAKQENRGGRGSGSAYFTINKPGTREISFRATNGTEIFRDEMARKVLDTLNNYERNTPTSVDIP
jgi:hypothetical protein